VRVDFNIHNKNDASLCNILELLSGHEHIIKIKLLKNPEPPSFCKNAFPLAAGSFSRVYHVELCAAHFKKPFDCSCKQPPLPFAWKIGRSNNDSERTQLDTEREVLTQLRQYSHPHIIDLLDSVQQEGRWGLLLPLAANDLDSMMTSDTPHQDPLYASWLLGQLRGLVSALKLLHSGFKEPETKSFLGWHGDIKPSNILFMRSPSKMTDCQPDGYGRFVLADFGLSRFKPKSRTESATRLEGAFDLQQSLGTEQILADRQYIAPETEIEHEKSPAADIWSLGCVMLEALVWITYGAASRQELLKELNTRERNPFWMVLEPSKVVLRPVVISWIERLEKNMKGDHVLFPALKLIRPGLLNPDPQKRLSAATLLERLEQPSAHPDLAQNSSDEGSDLLGTRDSLQSTNVQTIPKHDLRREAPDKVPQPNGPLAKVDVPSGSTGLAITTAAKNLTVAPPRMRSGGVTRFRSGDFVGDQRLLNMH
jgi:serine/threonine protein kinase